MAKNIPGKPELNLPNQTLSRDFPVNCSTQIITIVSKGKSHQVKKVMIARVLFLLMESIKHWQPDRIRVKYLELNL